MMTSGALVILALTVASLTGCGTVQLAPEQTTRLSELEAFADQMAEGLGSVTLEARTQLGLMRRLGADRPIIVDQWMPFVPSYRVVLHPELLSTKWCAEWVVAHGLEWARQGHAGGLYVAPVWAAPIVIAAEAARAQAAREKRAEVAAETRTRLRQVRGWTDTEFTKAHQECQQAATRFKAQE